MHSLQAHAPPRAGLMPNASRALCPMHTCQGLHRSCIPTGTASRHRSCVEGRPECAMHSLPAPALPCTCAAACGPYAQCIRVWVCTAAAFPRVPSHCTAVALKVDRSAQCTRFRHVRQCAMHIYCPIAPQMQSGLVLHRRCFATSPRAYACNAPPLHSRAARRSIWESMPGAQRLQSQWAPLMLHQSSSLRHKGLLARPRAQSTYDPALHRKCICVRNAHTLAWLHRGCTQAAPSTTDAFAHVQCLALRGFSPVLCLQPKHTPVHIAEPAHSCLSALSAAHPPWSAMTCWKPCMTRSHVVTWTWKSSLRIWSSCS